MFGRRNLPIVRSVDNNPDLSLGFTSLQDESQEMPKEACLQLNESDLLFKYNLVETPHGKIIRIELHTSIHPFEDLVLGSTLFASDPEKQPGILRIYTGFFSTKPTGCGLGTKMFYKLNRIFQEISNSKHIEVIHGVHPTNKNNTRLYQRLGYQLDEECIYNDSGEFYIKEYFPSSQNTLPSLQQDELDLLQILNSFYSTV